MASCAACNKTILFGGVKEGGHRFCNRKCLADGEVLFAAAQIPDDVVRQKAREVHAGACPVCQQHRGPVDIHTAHKIWSLVFMSSWSSRPQVSCRACGLKSQLYGTLSSLLIGWWGIPWGIIMTPVQICKNLFAMLRPHEAMTPSEQLEKLVRLNLATNAVAHGRGRE